MVTISFLSFTLVRTRRANLLTQGIPLWIGDRSGGGSARNQVKVPGPYPHGWAGNSAIDTLTGKQQRALDVRRRVSNIEQGLAVWLRNLFQRDETCTARLTTICDMNPPRNAVIAPVKGRTCKGANSSRAAAPPSRQSALLRPGKFKA